MTDTTTPPETTMNPMQQEVLEALSKQPDWQPLSRSVIESIREQLHEGLAEVAARLSPDNAMWVS